MYAWEHFLGLFNFDYSPIGTIGCPVIFHTNPNIQKTWDFCGPKGFNIEPALKHYRCFHVVDGTTKALLFSNTVELPHKYLTEPTFTKGDCIFHVINFLSCAVKDTPTTIHHEHITTISKLRDIFKNWIPKASMKPPTPSPVMLAITSPAPPDHK